MKVKLDNKKVLVSEDNIIIVWSLMFLGHAVIHKKQDWGQFVPKL